MRLRWWLWKRRRLGYRDHSLRRRSARLRRHGYVCWRIHVPHLYFIWDVHSVNTMAHFAQIDENSIVQQVLVIDQTEIDTGNWGDPARWIQTSYNTRGGVYYIPNSSPLTPGPDQSKALNKNYAGIGYVWLPDGPDGPGFVPPKPFPSWLMNNFSYLWEAPVPIPTPSNPPYYFWDEPTLSWVLLDPQP